MFLSILYLELILVCFLIAANAFFSWAEFSVISARPSKIAQWVLKGKRGAKTVERWKLEPSTFLATIQIGVTLVGTLASALSGVIAVKYIRPALMRIAWLQPWAELVAIALVVAIITYLSLVFGEMVPKSLALLSPERSACLAAIPIRWLAHVFSIVVKILTSSTSLVMRLLKKTQPEAESFVSEEEVRFMIKQGAAQGVFDATEQQLIPKIFDFSCAVVRQVMIPKERIVGLELNISRDELLRRVGEELYTRMPVYRENLDQVVGILHMKDLIYVLTIGRAVILHDIIRPPLFVRAEQPAREVLALFQKRHQHLAIVKDGGRTVGLVTMEDLLEKIVGDIQDEQDVMPVLPPK